jgi:branched-chain amino acid transport system substrate-binding protein
VFDSNTDTLLYRNETSDGQTGLAMGVWACHMGYKTAAMMFEAEPTAQAFKPYVVQGFKSCGGRIVATEDLQSSQSTYQTEVAKVVAAKPDVIFTETPSASGPMWSNFKELDNLAIPFIGSDSTLDPNYIKGIGGNAVAHATLTSLTGATPSGPAYSAMASLMQSIFHNAPAGDAPWQYDAVIIMSLAMDMAHSTSGTVYTKDMTKISDPSGQACTSYAGCLALIKKGDSIDYQGASGTNLFNKNHNVFSEYDAVKVAMNGNYVTVGAVSAAQLSAASK